MDSQNLIDLIKGIEESMGLINEQMTSEVIGQMNEKQLELLEEVRKASSREELKKMTAKLSKINERLRDN
jgi:hypothetical protein